jgi:serine/threonine-protein kinase
MERLAAAMLPVPPVRSLAPTIPVSLANVLDRALAFEPEDRFASAHEMQAAVRAAMGAVAEPTERVRPGKIPQLRPKTRGRMPTPAEIAGVVLVCGAVLSVVLGIALGVDATPSSPRAILPPVPVAPASTSAPPTERSDLPDGPLVAITAAPPARLPAPPPPARALVRTPDASSARVPPPPPPPSARRAVDPLAGRF